MFQRETSYGSGSSASPVGNSKRVPKRRSMFRKNKELFILSLPALIYILVMSYLPMIGVIIAFKQYYDTTGIFGSPWVGLQNFRFFFDSPDAWLVTRNTILYNAAFIVFGTLCAVGLALLMYQVKASKLLTIYQSAMLLPYFISWIVVAYIVYGFLSGQYGVVNSFLGFLGMKPINWYQAPQYWPYILVVCNLWRNVGFSTLVYFAGILGIDPTYFEAAIIDGASRWQIARRVTIPMISNLIMILFILSVGTIFNADFGLFYFVPNSSPFLTSVTQVINVYVYNALINVGNIGMAAAVGLYQSAVGFVLVLATNWIVRRISPEHSLF